MKSMMISIIILLPSLAFGEALSDLALFNRCYHHLTRKSPALNNPLLQAVAKGTKNAQEACIEILRKGKFQGNGTVQNRNDQEARDVLNTFYAVHAQWFMDPTLKGISAINVGVVDPSPGSLYLTKSLFDSSFDFQDIFDGAKSYEAIRTGGRPAKDVNNRDSSYYTVGHLGIRVTGDGTRPDEYFTSGYPWSGIRFPETGDLIGIRNETALTAPGFACGGSQANSANCAKTPHPFNGSKGGGILGNRDYVMRTVNASRVAADGGLVMPRRFGRAIFFDFLCQDLPVVSTSKDTAPYIDRASDIPFRTNAGCVACHISMDQVSTLVRNYTVSSVGVASNGGARLRVERETAATMTSAFTWPTVRDPDYFKKTANAKFVYRTTDDKLISRDVANFNALGNVFKTVDDVYLCAASRYFRHFTNINYPVTQIQKGISSQDPYAIFIKDLSVELKSTQNAMTTVERILKSDFYRDSNYGAGVNQ